jgi:hypothetical protein
MAILRNVRWEAFANHVARSPKTRWSLSQCYRQSGFKAVGHSSEMAASRLMKKDEVATRVRELQAPTARKTGYTLEALIARIEAAIAVAQADGAHSAVASNHALILKIIDMVEERNAAEQQFAGAMDTSEIMELIRDLVGDVVAAVVEAAIASNVYSTDIDKALEIIDGIRADLMVRTSAKAVLVS